MTRRTGDPPSRRLFDVLAACAGLALAGPAMVVIAALVRWRLGSPVLFRQARAGWHGKTFAIVKFRTMKPPRFPGEPDGARLTALGRLLRRLSLDELPQLLNILRGEMSVIGPRPTLPEQVRGYDRRQRGRLAVRPGLTGWAQVHGRNLLSWPERIELDLYYIEHRTWRLDLRILVRTLAQLVRPHGVVGPGGVNPGFPQPTERSDHAPEPERARPSAEPPATPVARTGRVDRPDGQTPGAMRRAVPRR